MYSFFILGQVPGTSITITFTMWAQLAGLVLALNLLKYAHGRQASLRQLPPTLGSN